MASFTKEVNPRLAKRPLVFNGRLANHGLTSLVKEATEHHALAQYCDWRVKVGASSWVGGKWAFALVVRVVRFMMVYGCIDPRSSGVAVLACTWKMLEYSYYAHLLGITLV